MTIQQWRQNLETELNMTNIPDELAERLVAFLTDLKYLYANLTDKDKSTLNEILVQIQRQYGQNNSANGNNHGTSSDTSNSNDNRNIH